LESDRPRETRFTDHVGKHSDTAVFPLELNDTKVLTEAIL